MNFIEPPKIDLVAPFPPPYGGMGVRFEMLAAILAGRGYDCRKIKIPWLDTQERWNKLHRAGSFLLPAWQVLHSRAGIIHVVTGSIPNALAVSVILIAGKLTRKRVLLSIGGGDFARFSKSAKSIYRWAMRHVLELADVVVPCNQVIEESLYDLGITRERVVYISNALPDEIGARLLNTPDATFFAFCQVHKPVFLFIGAMHQHYGLLDVLTAMEYIQEDYSDWGLVAMVKEGGDALYNRQILEYLKAKQLTEKVKIYQSVPWTVAAMQYTSAMIRATNITDGDSRAVREALAVRLPVVASDICARPQGVLLYRAGDAADLARALKDSLGDNVHIPELSTEEGEQNIRKYEMLYQKLTTKY